MENKGAAAEPEWPTPCLLFSLLKHLGSKSIEEKITVLIHSLVPPRENTKTTIKVKIKIKQGLSNQLAIRSGHLPK